MFGERSELSREEKDNGNDPAEYRPMRTEEEDEKSRREAATGAGEEGKGGEA